jgi:hypothetical protein
MTEEQPEELAMGQKITDLGNQVKEAKGAGKPKEEWDPILKEMLALKVSRNESASFSPCLYSC